MGQRPRPEPSPCWARTRWSSSTPSGKPFVPHQPEQTARALAYAAALRIARFGTANEFSDWITASMPSRIAPPCTRRSSMPSLELVRGLFHGVSSVYLDRFLNVPAARLPGEDSWATKMRTNLTSSRGSWSCWTSVLKWTPQARLVAGYLRHRYSVVRLVTTCSPAAAVREDADFHTFQVVEAGVRQYQQWQGMPKGNHILIAVARYLAAHAPTQRRGLDGGDCMQLCPRRQFPRGDSVKRRPILGTRLPGIH